MHARIVCLCWSWLRLCQLEFDGLRYHRKMLPLLRENLGDHTHLLLQILYLSHIILVGTLKVLRQRISR